jgi:hypothetical protein
MYVQKWAMHLSTDQPKSEFCSFAVDACEMGKWQEGGERQLSFTPTAGHRICLAMDRCSPLLRTELLAKPLAKHKVKATFRNNKKRSVA